MRRGSSFSLGSIQAHLKLYFALLLRLSNSFDSTLLTVSSVKISAEAAANTQMIMLMNTGNDADRDCRRVRALPLSKDNIFNFLFILISLSLKIK